MKKILKCFWGFTPNPHHGSAIDLGETTNKNCDDKTYVIFYFNYLLMLGAGNDYRLKKIS